MTFRNGPTPSLVVLALALLAPGIGADYQSGLDAYNAGRYDVAMRDWIAIAERPPGSTHPAIYAETYYAIGMLYWMGEGVTKDYYEASNWLHKAGELGQAGAQLILGFMYAKGVAVPQDYEQAFEWFQLAAKQGEVDAQYNMGLYYLNGWGVEQDTTLAAQWLGIASAQGDQESEDILQTLLPVMSADSELQDGFRSSLRDSGMTGSVQGLSFSS